MSTDLPAVVTIECAAGCGHTVDLDFSDQHWATPGGRRDRDRIVAAASRSRCDDCLAEEVHAERARAELQRREQLLLQANLPPIFKGLAWGDMDRSNGRDVVIDEAARWADDDGADLFIHSRPGTGKSRLAAIAAQERIARLRPVRWVNAPTLFLQANADFRSDARAEAEEVLFNRDPLVLDDLGKENPSEWSRGVLITALDTRLEHHVPMLITSNLTVPELAAKYTFSFDSGDWLASRLAGYFRQYQMPGIDRRLQLLP